MSDRNVILITGSRKGIGRGLAERYLDEGWTVAGCSRRAGTIERDGYRHFECCVSDESAVVSMVRSVVRDFGKIDAVLNNAGIASMNHSLMTPAESFGGILDTNLMGTFLLCREVGKVMARAGAGRIVNFSSVAVPLRLEGEAAYAASKAGIECLTRVLAQELGPAGVTVNAVGPTPVDTDLLGGVPQKKLDHLISRQAIQRMGTIEDVKAVVDFFLKPASGFVTGQVVYLGGVG